MSNSPDEIGTLELGAVQDLTQGIETRTCDQRAGHKDDNIVGLAPFAELPDIDTV